jgi:formate hydrogenlyase subunit 4
MKSAVIWAIQISLIPVLSPLFAGIIRKIKAVFQNRAGARITQPYYDIWKLFHKDEVISTDASWIFKFAPYMIFAVTIVIGASVPLFTSIFSYNLLSDLLVVVYLLALATFFLALAGMDTGSPFGGFASSREMTLAALAEGGLVSSLLALALAAHSTNLFSMVHSASSLSIFSFPPVLLAFFAFLIAMLFETAHFPFDNPATHLELTMIHEAMILEYSGKRLALLEWAAANKQLIFLSLGVNMFFPWGLTASAEWTVVLTAVALYLLKVLILSLFVSVLESSMAKFRFFRLPDLLLMSFILSVIAIILMI